MVNAHYKLIYGDNQFKTSYEEDDEAARIKTFLTLMFVQLEPVNWKNMREALDSNDEKDLATEKQRAELSIRYKKLYWAVATSDDDLSTILSAINYMGKVALKKIKENVPVRPSEYVPKQ